MDILIMNIEIINIMKEEKKEVRETALFIIVSKRVLKLEINRYNYQWTYISNTTDKL